jgi:hypothetical protein
MPAQGPNRPTYAKRTAKVHAFTNIACNPSHETFVHSLRLEPRLFRDVRRRAIAKKSVRIDDSLPTCSNEFVVHKLTGTFDGQRVHLRNQMIQRLNR